MEVEGVVQYRLLGSHPAASGRYHSFGFSGETVPLEALLQAVVKQHQINLTKYKFEVRRLLTAGAERQDSQTALKDATNDVLPLGTLLRTYDRIAVSVLRRHYMDRVNSSDQLTEENLLEHVEGLLQSEEAMKESQAPCSCKQKRSRGSEDTADPHAFSRVAALSNKAFPLLPWLQRQRNTDMAPLPKPTRGKCVLCELESLEEVVLACCRYSACRQCLELARAMLTNENECAVCGALLAKPNAYATGRRTTTAPVKQEGSSTSPVSTAVRGEQAGIHSAYRQEAKTVGNKDGAKGRFYELVESIESDLKKNMARVLSLLDVADPINPKAKEKRKVSAALSCFDEK
ncbi:uncharacterized protein Tco025E_02348 [Trypanosoma conorhini]|uniref:RING-type domain-containing protein n=1 Tax=Trypanosoma conorhini TaxID=83891 RepID=A0A3R7PUF6_9TRYP|nr:uncharacterized protein Tco025E_02348 [Trypanosoma conorhini]RNF25325.1 hypothetical protein Tco025E_02348 [Trypanosoma conorhini]